ncbi:glycoside hydrolase family 28 protein [Iocasia frigidifontis]|uniref:Glycoside hydrolase family 28 protein n=1 Tax=Iocasia fonsfrigidae TaxID=2682810 RepID=A0A8A7K7Y0_9FIRM|nr:glycoside hydrolase family 28 protein [Iocasia fonsfrigidae]QTL97300.1 glycoside hydrolase family 28 protein [Iocasia fonsfrigidae]
MNKNFYNITDYGAVGDGKTINTAAFDRAIQECAENGGGTVYVPAGIFLTASITLKSNITLYFEIGSIVKFVQDVAQYKLVQGRWEGSEQELYTSLIHGKDLENITISGRGFLDGQGEYWWQLFKNNELKHPRPRFIAFRNCDNVLIEGIRLVNSPAWTINPVECHNVTVNKVTIKNPANSPNTDGINPSSSKNVQIANCHIDVGDDCIALKSGTEDCPKFVSCENITIINCTMVHGHGGVVIGSEMSGDIRNVVISNCIFEGTDRGIRLKSRRGRGGLVEDIRVNNIIMKDVFCTIIMNLYYFCGKGGKDKRVWDKEIYPVDKSTPSFRRIHFSDITAREVRNAAVFLYGLPEMPLEEITFDNISIELAEDARPAVPAMADKIEPVVQQGFYCNNVRDIKFINVRVSGHLGPGFEIVNAEGIDFNGCKIDKIDENDPCILFDGVRDTYFSGNRQEKIKGFLKLRDSKDNGRM